MAKVLERKKVEFPLWRKKVDSNLLHRGETTLPSWVADIWDLPKVLSHATASVKDSANDVDICLKGWKGPKDEKNPKPPEKPPNPKALLYPAPRTIPVAQNNETQLLIRKYDSYIL